MSSIYIIININLKQTNRTKQNKKKKVLLKY